MEHTWGNCLKEALTCEDINPSSPILSESGRLTQDVEEKYGWVQMETLFYVASLTMLVFLCQNLSDKALENAE